MCAWCWQPQIFIDVHSEKPSSWSLGTANRIPLGDREDARYRPYSRSHPHWPTQPKPRPAVATWTNPPFCDLSCEGSDQQRLAINQATKAHPEECLHHPSSTILPSECSLTIGEMPQKVWGGALNAFHLRYAFKLFNSPSHILSSFVVRNLPQ